jgi:hypothetical protein
VLGEGERGTDVPADAPDIEARAADAGNASAGTER